MESIRDPMAAARSMASWLEQESAWSFADRMALFRRVVLEVRARHDQGQIHGSIDIDHVLIGPGLKPILAPAGSPPRLGSRPHDPECCPPEMRGLEPVDLPHEMDAAAAVLAASGLSCDARRIDVYQLGVLLCRLVTGETVAAYMYDADVKRRIPTPLRPVVEGALGFEAAARLNDCAGLLHVLDESLQRVNPPAAISPDSAAESCETPPRGSVLVPQGDTVTLRPEPTPVPDVAVSAPAVSPALPSSRLGHFRLIEPIGRGGMGDVYKAYDESLERLVAIKVLPPELARDEEFVRRFRAEAIAAAKIGHPNIVPVYYIGQEAGLHFFAMQYIEGESLEQRLRHLGRLPVGEAVRVVEQCLGALQAAHAGGLVHRDVKPGNILLEAVTQRALLVDFGLVRAVGSTRLTMTGTVMGTVDYIAPEQARGHPVDGRADIYSLGVVLYQLLAGRLPFEADSAAAMLFRHAYEPPLPLADAAPDIPEVLRTVVARMMVKDPAQRYANCEAVQNDLCAFREGRQVSAMDESAPMAGARATAILSAPVASPDLEPPQRLAEWTAPRRLGRLRDFAATMFRRHAPEFVKELQNTSQWIDGAIAEYERRCRRLAKLVAEAGEIAAALAAQLEENRKAAATTAEDEHADEESRTAAAATRRRCEENATALAIQLEQQQREKEELELQLRKVEATLVRLRSQRDLLQARFRMAALRRELASGERKPPAKGIPTTVIVVAAVLISIAAVVVLDWYQTSRSTDAPQTPVSPPSGGFTGTREAQRGPYDSSGQKRDSTVPISKPQPTTEAELARRTISNSIGMELVLIPPGQFIMGTDKRDVDMLADRHAARGVLDDEHGPNEMPPHRVRITRPFYLGRFEVTQGEYQKVMGSNPSRWMLGPVPPAGDTTASAETAKLSMAEAISPAGVPPKSTTAATDEHQYYPVDSVTEEQAEEFCKKLSALEDEKRAGRTYRLPTEAEWEYACRAGTQTAFSFNEGIETNAMNDADIGPDDRPILHGTKPVGTYRPNAFGLYDMHGNVWEWCSDRYERDFYSKSPVTDPHNSPDPRVYVGPWERALRGGSSADTLVACRSAFRGHCRANKVPSSPTGFRVVCEKAPSTRSP